MSDPLVFGIVTRHGVPTVIVCCMILSHLRRLVFFRGARLNIEAAAE